MNKKMNFKKFNSWLESAIFTAVSMQEPKLKEMHDDLLEETIENLEFIAELVKSRQLIYKKQRNDD